MAAHIHPHQLFIIFFILVDQVVMSAINVAIVPKTGYNLQHACVGM